MQTFLKRIQSEYVASWIDDFVTGPGRRTVNPWSVIEKIPLQILIDWCGIIRTSTWTELRHRAYPLIAAAVHRAADLYGYPDHRHKKIGRNMLVAAFGEAHTRILETWEDPNYPKRES